MRLSEAKTILELPEEYSDEDIKKNYRRLVLKYHPDRYKGPSEKFIKVQEAYELLNKEQTREFLNTTDFMDSIHSIFKNIHVPNFKTKETRDPIPITLTVKEYITGATKKIKQKKSNCSCEKSLCLHCAGCGYDISNFKRSLDVCMNCLGDGYTTLGCNCYDYIEIKTEPFTHDKNVSISDESYFLSENKLYYNLDITFKESILGFEKTFIDPLDCKHLITVREIIKNGDGYSIKMNGNEVILLFKIKYPKKLPEELRKTLLNFDF
jgi:DnaJ-class molecular chaperone